MKVAYYSPMPPSTSGIADYSALLVPELAKLIDLEVVSAPKQKARGCDVALYHVGNSAEFHDWIVEELQKKIGPRLADIEKELATIATTKVKNPGPSSGYHSSISPAPDVAKWVQVDLGAEQGIREVILRPCFDTFNNIGAGFGFPRRFRVEVSNDPEFKTGITTVVSREDADVPNPGVEGQAFATGATGRYVRITATKLASRSNDFIFSLAELEVVSPEGMNVARGRDVTSLDSIEAAPRWRRGNLVDGEAPEIGRAHV